MGLDARKPDLIYAINNGSDEPAHPLSLIRVFVIHSLVSIRTPLAACKILMF